MSHQVLARKWRPKQFAEVVGQDHVVTALSNALDTGRIHHAYLFTGTRGVGKTTLARILAKALNCEGADGKGEMTSTPCGVCSACREIDAGRFVDLLEVDAATNTKVDEMRELLETAQYMPVSGRYKVYIIDEVHMLSKSAFNSMLKTLEEPPGHVQFILATTDPQKLPITVLSRCLQFNLKQLPAALLAGHLRNVLESEKVGFEEPALKMLAAAAEGSVRDSLSLLDQAIAFGAGSVNADDVAKMLGALDHGYLLKIVEALIGRDAKSLVRELEGMSARSLSFDMAMRDFAALMQRLALNQAVGESADDEQGLQLVGLAQQLNAEDIQLFYQIAILGRRDLGLAPDELSGATMTFLRMLTFSEGGARAARQSSEAVVTPAAMHSSGRTVTKAKLADSDSASAEEAVPEFNGDWVGLVQRLRLSSMAGMLARQSEYVRFQGRVLELVIPEDQKHLLDKAYQDKLRQALEAHFGHNLRLNIGVSAAVGKTAATVETQAMVKEQRRAEKSIENDAFVKELIADFGADVQQATIRPVQ